MPPEVRADAAHAVCRVFEAKAPDPPPIVAVYDPMGSELDPTPLALWLWDRGTRVALPVIVAPDRPLVFVEAHAPDPEHDFMTLRRGGDLLQPDLVFAPLIAFDRTGARLGQGKGFYDRTIAALRCAAVRPRIVGLAFSIQEEPHVPTGPYDQRLDGVLTESAYLDFTGDL